MRVNISDSASNYILSKGGELLIFMGRTDGCCVGTVYNPSYELGKPRRSLENYRILKVGEVTVYLDEDISNLSGSIDISLDSILGWKAIGLNYKD